MRFFILILFLLASTLTWAQSKKQVTIAFYNVENLFDVFDDPLTNDHEFLPEGEKQWTEDRYCQKLESLSSVIAQLGNNAPSVLGVCEVENKLVLEDLARTQHLKKQKYEIVHFDSPDQRGIDVGLLYNPQHFELSNSKTYTLTLPGNTDFHTRNQLVVSGELMGEEFHFIVVHWSSRRGGQEKSEPKRIAAAQLTRHIVDSLLTQDANAKIVVMGDFNDDPSNASLTNHLKTTAHKNEVVPCENTIDNCAFYNPMAEIHKPATTGTLAWKGKWNLFDQTILSPALVAPHKKGLQFESAAIFSPDFLRQQQDNKYKGYPDRTYAGTKYLGGSSDHFPVVLILTQ